MKKKSRILTLFTALVCASATFSLTAAKAAEKNIILQTITQTATPTETVSITTAPPTETPSPSPILIKTVRSTPAKTPEPETPSPQPTEDIDSSETALPVIKEEETGSPLPSPAAEESTPSIPPATPAPETAAPEQDAEPSEAPQPDLPTADVITSSDTEVMLDPEDYPKVIDHINFPEEYVDFSFSGEDDLLEIWFPSVRDQDAAIFLYQDQVWMLDCGDERSIEESVPLLRSLGVTKIDKLFNTHPHHDHLNGLYNIDKYIPIKELLICFPEDETKHMTAAMEYCKGNGITITAYRDEDVFLMGDGLVSFLAWQKTDEYESINDRSGQFMISYGDCSMLSMADMETHGQRQLYDALGAEPLKADILRYPHHGKLGMVNEVYLAIDPSLVIITNRYRIAEVRQSSLFLDNKHANVAYTHRNNVILHLTTDGNHWLCEEVVFDAASWMPEAAETNTETTVTVSTTTESAEPEED